MVYLIIYRVSIIQGGAGFLPSTVFLNLIKFEYVYIHDVSNRHDSTVSLHVKEPKQGKFNTYHIIMYYMLCIYIYIFIYLYIYKYIFV